MESRAFIREADALAQRIAELGVRNDSQESNALQKDINGLFQGLANPTLMAATRLAEVAQAHRYSVKQEILNKIREADNIWSQ